MKTALLFLLASIASAASLTLTSSDPRWNLSTKTATFLSTETMPNDWGIQFTATLAGGGSWTVGSETGATCGNPLAGWYVQQTPTASPATISTISANGTVFVAPTVGTAGGCPVGTYTHTYTLTNGADTYTFTVVQAVIYRLSAPVFLNGCGVTDASLSGGAQGNCPGGQTQAPTISSTFTYRLNKLPCSDCRPGGTFNMPPPGSSSRDQFGNLHTVITPACFVAAADAEKTELSKDDTWIVAQSLGCPASTYGSGGWFIFPSTGSATPSYALLQSDFGNGLWVWSNSSDVTTYGFIDPAAYSGVDTPFKKVVLGAAAPSCTTGCYTASTLWTMPYATYGRGYSTAFSHQDMNKLGWFAMITVKDYQGQVDTSGFTITRRMGQPLFDTATMLDQYVSVGAVLANIASCADTDHCTTTQSLGTQTNVTFSMQAPYKLCAFNWQDIDASGGTYAPVCLDLNAQARPHQTYTSVAAYISKDVDPVTGKLYISLDGLPGDIGASFTPGDANLTYLDAWTMMSPDAGYQFGSKCTAANTVLGNPGQGTSYCYGTAHSTAFQLGDGSQWFLHGNSGAAFETMKFSSMGQLMVSYASGNGLGNFHIPLWTQDQGGEYSGARKAPYMLASTGNVRALPSWNVTGCTSANPMVVTVSASTDTYINTSTHNKVLIGGVLGNASCNGSRTVTAVSGTHHEVWTVGGVDASGASAYTASTGDATEDVANPIFHVLNCTNTSPVVVTLDTMGVDTKLDIRFPHHDTVTLSGVGGNTNCNGTHTITDSSADTSLHSILTLNVNGNSAYTSGGELVESAANGGPVAADADQMFLLRESGQEVRLFGHTRSVSYADRCTSSYYAVSRASISMDAKYAVYTTNNGIPGCSEQVVMATTGVDNGIGMTSSKFDSTHGVTSASYLAGVLTLLYSTPDTGNAIVDVCVDSQRWPDAAGGMSTDTSCKTATDSSGANPRTTVISGLANGTPYYRVAASNKWVAWGASTAGPVPTSGPRKAGPARSFGGQR